MELNKYTGIAIALAFPDTYCKQAGAWYDKLLNFLGIANNNYYKVGHAAVLLIDAKNRKCRYFDFGRYHAPYGHGRVRSEETDIELIFKTKAILSDDNSKIENYDGILSELQRSDVYHGEGNLYASYTQINYKKAYKKAIEMQNNSPLLYGPFTDKGSNCSRFVSTVIRAGNLKFWHWFKLYFFNPFTPTPKSNIKALSYKAIKPKLFEEEKFCPTKKNKISLKNTLPPPERHKLIHENALWLSGEGAGSWFVLEINENILKSDRYSPNGKLECSGSFKSESEINFTLSDKFELSYLTNYKSVKIIFQHKECLFQKINTHKSMSFL